ncbi:SDR family NAD(P)-dependent oxidoreductase [Paenochrobactrum sp. BZR 588]|uniref:SDR family NAD(P)-dependent oxidoreductase n=1 Tax=Paenochrobactrum TaxID=999488 RepID=UPI0035BC09EB
MDNNEINDVALVTGGGSGIGRACALQLADRGASVVVADLNQEGIDETVALIHAQGQKALGIKLDVSDPQSVENAFTQTAHWRGSCHILVNCAGILVVQPLLDFPLDAWNRLMAINLTGTFLCSQRAARDMVKKRYGRIINMASISGSRAGVGRVAYGTSKAAISGLTRQFALELGAYGITANAIAPGAIVTAMTEAAYTDETRAKLLPMIPSGHLGEVDDIAAAVCYLASPQAKYVNGHILAVDGGYLASGMTQTGSLELKSAN